MASRVVLSGPDQVQLGVRSEADSARTVRTTGICNARLHRAWRAWDAPGGGKDVRMGYEADHHNVYETARLLGTSRALVR